MLISSAGILPFTNFFISLFNVVIDSAGSPMNCGYSTVTVLPFRIVVRLYLVVLSHALTDPVSETAIDFAVEPALEFAEFEFEFALEPVEFADKTSLSFADETAVGFATEDGCAAVGFGASAARPGLAMAEKRIEKANVLESDFCMFTFVSSDVICARWNSQFHHCSGVLTAHAPFVNRFLHICNFDDREIGM